jgi:S-adenosylmethionine synthetase
MSYLFSSEAVSVGHPDKICDQISDAILDAYLQQDPDAKVAVECLITSQKLVVAGEVESHAKVDAVDVARQVLLDIGYNSLEVGFDAHTAEYQNLIHRQSPFINSAVKDGGAGDQGIMFGYATNETDSLLPLPYYTAQQLILKQQELRKTLPWLLPDAKSQVTFRYDNKKPLYLHNVVLSTQHSANVSDEELQKTVREEIILPLIQDWINPYAFPQLYINPSGSFLQGGPHSDTGLTGRKIVVDTYGGSCPHGGGAFSGKDPSKVDRSAAYAARFAAKQIVWSGLANRCTVQLSYAIGHEYPLSVYVDTHGSGTMPGYMIADAISKLIDFTPNGIIQRLGLKNPIYNLTARNGHFTNKDFLWEQKDSRIISSLQNL